MTRRSRPVRSWVAALAAIVVVAAAACTPPTEPEPPPALVDVTDAPFYRWVKDEPVEVRFGASGVGEGIMFELQSGSLPTGVELGADGRLTGVPVHSGTWDAQILASGSTGSTSGSVSGYVVEDGQIGAAPTLETNPLRSPFSFKMPDEVTPSSSFLYRPGSVTPESAPVYTGSATAPPGPSEYPLSDLNLLPLFRTQTVHHVISEPERCEIEQRSANDVLIHTTLLRPDRPCGQPYSAELTTEGPVLVFASVDANGDGTWTVQHWFVRTSDGEVLRTVSRATTSNFPSTRTGDGGSLAAFNTGQENELEVIGVDPQDDRTISFEDPSDRVCSARGVSIADARAAGSQLLLSCETPGESYQVGTVDLRSGELWLSAPIAATNPETGRRVGFFPLGLSPAGAQIVIQWGEYEGRQWPPYPPNVSFFKWGVIEVGDDDAGIQVILHDPPDTGGYFIFRDD